MLKGNTGNGNQQPSQAALSVMQTVTRTVISSVTEVTAHNHMARDKPKQFSTLSRGGFGAWPSTLKRKTEKQSLHAESLALADFTSASTGGSLKTLQQGPAAVDVAVAVGGEDSEELGSGAEGQAVSEGNNVPKTSKDLTREAVEIVQASEDLEEIARRVLSASSSTASLVTLSPIPTDYDWISTQESLEVADSAGDNHQNRRISSN